MCSVGDDNYEETDSNSKVMPIEENNISRKCNKCRDNSSYVLLRNKDSYCKECFLSGTIHKFKALLGKHRLIRVNDKVLVYHKFGHASAALIDFLRSGLNLDTHKKLRFQSLFIFIEDNWDFNLDIRRDIIKSIQSQVAEFNFDIYYVSLAEYIRNCTDSDKVPTINTDPSLVSLTESDKNVLEDVLQKKANVTNKIDMLSIYRRELLIKTAKHLGCKFIFTPEISTDISSQLLTNISLGRGCHIPLDTGFADRRDSNVSILRPLRNFESKELALYNFYCNVPVVSVIPTSVNPFSSVQNLMKKFVSDLQVTYPATVTTILKTGDKLDLDKDLPASNVCVLCKGLLEYTSEDLSSAESTKFSHWVSTRTQNNELSAQDRFSETTQYFINDKCDNYCYGCKKLSLIMK